MPTPKEYRQQIQQIVSSATALAERVEIEGATDRDLAMTIELNAAYIDILGEMENEDNLNALLGEEDQNAD